MSIAVPESLAGSGSGQDQEHSPDQWQQIQWLGVPGKSVAGSTAQSGAVGSADAADSALPRDGCSRAGVATSPACPGLDSNGQG